MGLLKELGVLEVRPFLVTLIRDGDLETFEARLAGDELEEDLLAAARDCAVEETLA